MKEGDEVFGFTIESVDIPLKVLLKFSTNAERAVYSVNDLPLQWHVAKIFGFCKQAFGGY